MFVGVVLIVTTVEVISRVYAEGWNAYRTKLKNWLDFAAVSISIICYIVFFALVGSGFFGNSAYVVRGQLTVHDNIELAFTIVRLLRLVRIGRVIANIKRVTRLRTLRGRSPAWCTLRG